MARHSDDECITDHQMMLYAALQLLEAQDAGHDTTHQRALYEQCRARVKGEKHELEAWISAGAHLDGGPRVWLPAGVKTFSQSDGGELFLPSCPIGQVSNNSVAFPKTMRVN